MRDWTGRELQLGQLVMFSTAERDASFRLGIIAKLNDYQVHVMAESKWRLRPNQTLEDGVKVSKLYNPRHRIMILDHCPPGKEDVAHICRVKAQNP